MNKTLKVLFYLKPPKKYEGGPMPIYMRLTVDGKRIEISTQRECDPLKWDIKACRVLGLKRELTRQLNNYLDALQGKIFEAQRELQMNGIEVTAENIRDFLRGKLKDDEPTITLLQVYRTHVVFIAKIQLQFSSYPKITKNRKSAYSCLCLVSRVLAYRNSRIANCGLKPSCILLIVNLLHNLFLFDAL